MFHLNVHCADSIHAEADHVGDTVWVTITPDPDNDQSGVNLFLSSTDQVACIIEALYRAATPLSEIEHDAHAAHDDREAFLGCRFCWPGLTPQQRHEQARAAS